MKTINKNMAIGQIVSEIPSTANYFIKKNIDFCCGGERPLEEAIKDSTVPLETVLEDLNALKEKNSVKEKKWKEASPEELIDNIVDTHHSFLRENLPAIDRLLFKVLFVHGDTHEELFKIHELFSSLKGELERHLIKEEKLLFPAIKENNQKLINILTKEHDAAGDLIKEIKEVTDHYTLPEGACRSYELLYNKLEVLELDIYHHVHLENNILFKKLK